MKKNKRTREEEIENWKKMAGYWRLAIGEWTKIGMQRMWTCMFGEV